MNEAATYPGPRAPGTYPPVPAKMTKVCDNSSVGVVITDDRGRVLLFQRTTPPVGRAPVAGHVDDHGAVEEAARAEVAEEVGLTVTALVPVIVRWRNNVCRRQHGPIGPGHNWTVYRADVTGAVDTDPAEARDARWYAPAEVQRLAERTAAHARGDITAAAFAADPGIGPVWAQFLQTLGLLDLHPADHQAIEHLTRRSPYDRTL